MFSGRFTAAGSWLVGVVLGFIALTGRSAEPIVPIIAGAEGQRAFADLAKFYYKRYAKPPGDQAIGDLQSSDAVKRTSAGKYLLALLAQSQADESNGRGNWQQSPFWGHGEESDARDFRQSLAEKLATNTKSAEILDAALWLVQDDEQVEHQKCGVKLLCRIESSRSAEIYRKLLAPPHPCQAVLLAVIDETSRRKLTQLAPELRSLGVHYRTAVRNAARICTKALGGTLPEFRPEDAFTPWLDRQLKDIAKMVAGGVSKDAKWCKFTITHPKQDADDNDRVDSFHGWLISEGKDQLEVMDVFGNRARIAKTQTKVERSTLQEQARALIELRNKPDKGGTESPRFALSRQGILTGQFEPNFISLPEALVAAWLYERGDKKLTAELLFPRIDEAEDDRWLVGTVRDLLGHTYHQEMLDAFCIERDYDRTIYFARHLSQPVFNGYCYQVRAKRLAEQLAKRTDDFKGFRLPTPEEWSGLKKTLSRQRQIEYMANRLRLLNCPPESARYSASQSAKPGRNLFHVPGDRDELVNPFSELRNMEITVAELPTLVPFLADESFMPIYSFWRSFHPDRTLHQVNWAVAEVINDVAKRDLTQLETFNRLDEAGRKKHLEAIFEWCRRNASKTQKDMVLDSLATIKDWREFRRIAEMAVGNGLGEALPIIAARYSDFPGNQGDLVEICYDLDTDRAVAQARKWLVSDDLETRLWSALILLRHGDKARSEGLAELTKILDEDNGRHLYYCAVEPLLDQKNAKMTDLAIGILKKRGFDPSGSDLVLQELFLTGRQECLDFLLSALDRSTSHGPGLIDTADRVAEIVAHWQINGRYDSEVPDEQRHAQRENLKTWLKEQFAVVKAGKQPKIVFWQRPSKRSGWHLDAL